MQYKNKNWNRIVVFVFFFRRFLQIIINILYVYNENIKESFKQKKF